MHFTVYCTECGRPLRVAEDEAEEGAAECDRCGAMIEYRVRRNTAVIRLKSYATMIFPDEKCHDKKTGREDSHPVYRY